MNEQKNYLTNLYFLILPLIFVVFYFLFSTVTGPFWYAINSDPDYAYLLNSLNIATLAEVGHIDHPGTTLQFLGSIIIRIFYLFNIKNGSLADFVVKNPETILQIINYFLIAINFIILFFIGKRVYKLTENYLSAFIIQLTPFYSITIFEFGINRVSPDLLIFFTSMVLVYFLINYLFNDNFEFNFKNIMFLSLIIGFGIVSKIIYIPVIILPVIIIHGVYKKILFLLFTILSIIIFTLPIYKSYNIFLHWILGLITHSGFYGTGEEKFINFSQLIINLKMIIQNNLLLSLTNILSFVLILFVYLNKKLLKIIFSSKKYKLVIALFFVTLFSFFIVGKHYYGTANRYLLPAISLTGFNILLILLILKDIIIFYKINIKLLYGILLVTTILYFSFFFNQIVSIYNTKNDMKNEVVKINKMVEDKYSNYTKIYFYPCSSQLFALYFGSQYSKFQYYNIIKKDYNFEHIYFFNGVDVISSKNQKIELNVLKNTNFILQGGNNYATLYKKYFNVIEVYKGKYESLFISNP